MIRRLFLLWLAALVGYGFGWGQGYREGRWWGRREHHFVHVAIDKIRRDLTTGEG